MIEGTAGAVGGERLGPALLVLPGGDGGLSGGELLLDLPVVVVARSGCRFVGGDPVAGRLPALPPLPARRAGDWVIYIDPPFNTGKVQERRTLRTDRSSEGDRVGFQGRSYTTTELARMGYLIWAYDYGGRGKDRWPQKHDTILVYVKNKGGHFFDQDQIERIPYMAPGLVTAEKRERGKLPTDVWWHTIVPTNGKEKTGYPNQKPEGVLRRVIQASSAPGELVLDFFAGSGTTGAVAQKLGRRFVLVDQNREAIEVMRRRLGANGVQYLDGHGGELDLQVPEGESQSLF